YTLLVCGAQFWPFLSQLIRNIPATVNPAEPHTSLNPLGKECDGVLYLKINPWCMEESIVKRNERYRERFLWHG
ncbi:hypothetical protein, partial [Citrobacter freundii]|uniref:hypothetical protein n=1 Tax=Citrobacter freundii TaxID=546 RepID=UPI0019D6910D